MGAASSVHGHGHEHAPTPLRLISERRPIYTSSIVQAVAFRSLAQPFPSPVSGPVTSSPERKTLTSRGTIFTLFSRAIAICPASALNLRRINVRRPWGICTFGRLPIYLSSGHVLTDGFCPLSSANGPETSRADQLRQAYPSGRHSLVAFAGTAVDSGVILN